MYLTKTSVKLLLSITIFVMLFCFTGCSSDDGTNSIISSVTMDLPPIDNPDLRPVIKCLDCSSVSVRPGEIVNLCVTAYDPKGRTLSYAYFTQAGTIITIDCDAKWTLPLEEGRYKVTVLVSNGTEFVSADVEVDVVKFPILPQII